MLKLSAVEFVARAIPESFLVIFAIYAFAGTRINKKRYFLSSFIMMVMLLLIRDLPISYGTHTILGIMVIIVLSYTINKIDIMKAVQSTIIAIIVQFICEGFNIFIIQYVFKKDINYIFGNPDLKIIYGIPSLCIFTVILILRYIIVLKKERFTV